MDVRCSAVAKKGAIIGSGRDCEKPQTLVAAAFCLWCAQCGAAALLVAYLEQPNRATRVLSCAKTVPAGHICKRKQPLGAQLRLKIPGLLGYTAENLQEFDR
jgi:hypothetical protein